MYSNYKLELSKKEMISYGYRVVDTIVDHIADQSKKSPVFHASRKEMDKEFLENIPNEGQNAEAVLKFVIHHVLAETSNLSHPKAFAFVPSPNNFISIMADTLATGYNIFTGGWANAPAAVEIELLTTNWLLELFNFPVKKGGGIFTSGGSMANLTALVTARNMICGDDFSKAIIYLSDQAHSSNIKAIRTIGFKKEQIRIIKADNNFKLPINTLEKTILKDKKEGLKPFCIIANAGTTNTGAIDSLNLLAKISKRENMWLHVDAAFGGASILSNKHSVKLKGIDKANSITVDPHKWFFQPYEIGCLLVRNKKWLSKTFTQKPEYLKDIEGNTSEINFYDHGIQLTRSFRALKFYMSLKTFGLNSFRDAIDYSITLCEQVESYLKNNTNWEVISNANLAIINFRYHPINKDLSNKQLNELNLKISKKIIKEKSAMLMTTVLNNKTVLRMCLINPRTTLEDVTSVLKRCEDIAESLLNSKKIKDII